MSSPAPPLTEQQIQEELLRLDAYRNQLNALAQQHAILGTSRQECERARESLDGIDRAEGTSEYLLPLGGETFVRGSIVRAAPVLIGIGSGVAVEMDRPKAAELLAQRISQIDQAVRDLEGQMRTIDERTQILSRRLEAASRAAGGPDGVGRD
jgi:prefoldin alpha subunit